MNVSAFLTSRPQTTFETYRGPRISQLSFQSS